MGPQWRHSFARSLLVSDGFALSGVAAIRPNGQRLFFISANGIWQPEADVSLVLTEVRSGGNRTGWTLTLSDDSVEQYDQYGQLLSITTRAGFTETIAHDTAGLLQSVTGPDGRTLTFAHNSAGLLSSVTSSDGSQIVYGYDGNNNLSTVAYPGTSTNRIYTYGEGTNGQSYQLTGIVDENANRYATWQYDSSGRAWLSVHGDVNSTTDRVELSYSGDINSNTSATVTSKQWISVDGTSTLQRTHDFQLLFGVVKPKSANQACSNCSDGTTQSKTYDASGYPSSSIDFNGRIAQYTYNTRGLETQRIEAYGTPSARTTNTVWNASFRVPDSRAVLNASGVTESLTKWAYNTRGQALSRCEIDSAVSGAASYTCGASANAPAGVRQTSTTYCEQAGVTAGKCPLVGLTLSVDGPRTDVADKTTYTYYQTTDTSGCATLGGACHYMGDLYTVKNALSQVTTYVSYDLNGRVTRMSDANGTLTDMTYSPRGWLLTRTVRANANGATSVNDAATTFGYDNVGQVTKIAQPDGAYLAYTYDAAHRLTDIADNLGDTIHYTLDAAGNRTQEDTKDPSGTLKRTLARQYDQLSHLVKTLNASGAAVQTYQNPAEAAPSGIAYTNGYDGNGNAIYSVDANGVGTEQQYDPLNRLVKTLQDHVGSGATKDTSTQYAYDTRDNLTSVTDPDGLVTGYTYDGLNNLTRLQSPDTGSSSYTYDAAGNRVTQTDARGVTTTYAYDALNRLTAVSYPAGATLNVAYAYDQANSVTGCGTSYPKGRLTTITDASGSTVYCYDRRGNVLSKKQTVAGALSTTSYAYTLADRISKITYPSGGSAMLTRNAIGQVVKIAWKASATATTQTLLNAATYLSFGPLSQLTYGNGRTLSKRYDADYAIDQVVSSGTNGLIVDATVDALGNLVNASSTQGANPPTQKYLYDPLYRLTTVQTGTSAPLEAYGYGPSGDRTSATLNGGATIPYGYAAGTHHLASVGGAARSYDANGNTTATATQTLSYDARNRLSQANGASYGYNGKGERVRKTANGAATTFVYDEAGNLLGEYANGNAQEYVYLDGTLVGIATLAGSGSSATTQLYYVETDQLGTPRVAIKPGAKTASDSVVWKWDTFGAGAAFGTNAPSMQALTVNLRFPGQYFDAETGLNYNYFRDYEPATGKYIESDPVGLAGGINTYAYVHSQPMNASDSVGWYETGGMYHDERNTVICDGMGGMIPALQPLDDGNKRCGVGECESLHEKSHINDVKRVNPSVCIGKPRGTEVLASSKQESDATESLAFVIEIGCLRRKLASASCDRYCKEVLQNRIKQLEDVISDRGYN